MGALQRESHWRVDLGIAFLGVLLVAPSLWGGLHWDDIPMAEHLARWASGSPEHAWWDLFNLDAPDPHRRFGGRVPWWSVDHFFVRFFRPIASLTHLLDNAVWPSNPMAMHAQSIAWFAAMLMAALRMHRTLLNDHRVAAFAGTIYAASYVHAIPVGWISNRSAIISATFGFLTITAYVRWRRSGSAASWAPALLALSLLSAEGGIATFAFIAGYELSSGHEFRQGRWWKPALMLLLLALWRIGYNLGGFGAVGSGGYIDPIRSPAIFLQHSPERFLWLLSFLLSPIRILVAHGFPLWAAIVSGIIFLLAAAIVLREAVRPDNRVWLISSGLSLLPALAAVPGERLLTFAAAASSPLIASALVRYANKPRLSLATAAVVATTHLVASPAALFLGSYDQSYDLRSVSRELPTMASISTAEIKGRNLFILNAPDLATVYIMRSARAKAGLGAPAFTWNLFPADGPGEIQRVGCCTLEISHKEGLSRGPFVVYFRGPESPMRSGDTVETLSFTAEVLKVNNNGIPQKARFTLKEPLESPRNIFVTWNGDDFERISAESIPRQ